MKVITIKTLKTIVDDEIKKGNGDKKILLASDDEGNEFRPMYYGISPTEGNVSESTLYGVSMEDAENNYVILG